SWNGFDRLQKTCMLQAPSPAATSTNPPPPCRACRAAFSESEHRFDTLKVTAADLWLVSKATSG
ncbi:Hemoglobin subunit beta, partial [Dissostichus eleginoides]